MKWLHKGGQPVLYGGAPVKRPERSRPDCRHCPRPLKWSEENRGRAARWEAWRAGLLSGPSDDRERWNFFRLSAAARELEGEVFKKNLREAIGGLFGGN